MNLRSLINIVSEAAITNPYKTDADRAKFDAMTAADQAWLTQGGQVPDINDEFILNRAPNKGQPDSAKKQQGQAAQPATTPNKPVVQQKIEKLNQLVDKLAASRQSQKQPPSVPVSAGQTAGAVAGQAAQPAPEQGITQNADGTFTAHKKDGTTVTFNKDGKILKENAIAKDLVESFGYRLSEADLSTGQLAAAGGAGLAKAGLAKAGAKTLAKIAPGVGTTLSVADAWNRWKAGDRTGAVISALAAAGWLLPGPAGWIVGGGLDAANLGRDIMGGSDAAEKQAAQEKLSKQGDPKIIALQKFLKGQGADLGTTGPNKDGVDGIIGDKTRKAMDALNLSESQRAKLNQIVDEGKLGTAWDVAKGLGTAFSKGMKNPAVAKSLKSKTTASTAQKAFTGAAKAGGVVGRHPVASTAAGVGTGGYLGAKLGQPDTKSASTEPELPAGRPGSPSANYAARQGATEPQAEQPWTDEQKDLNRQIKDLIQDLGTTAPNDPAVAKAFQEINKKLDGINPVGGQAAQPATPKTSSTNNVDFYNRLINPK